ncbi:septum site-determining protein MinD [Cysteiniphilum halobium]|uniref:septum site-determining protein MinD n=1 Tax=Cysteiniphilum halobium TaxID=2219059 RepID=UPI001F26B5ED|nr:septum site-determining protein MinD [Cysteiniphilum halobium]
MSTDFTQTKNTKPRATTVVITSGKGGVGKTTTSAAISLALAMKGFKTVVIDFDVGLRNLDLVMGCERRVVYDLISLINKEANINQTLIKDKRSENLYILPASQTRDKDALTEAGLEDIMQELKANFDYIVCDSPAGIEKGALMAMLHADKAIVVTNPEVSSVRDSDRIIGVLSSKTRKAKEKGEAVDAKLLITRYDPTRVLQGEMLSLEDVKDVLSIPLLGVIPESKMVLQASNSGVPVTAYQDSEAGQAYVDAVERFLGHDKPLRFISAEKPGLLKRLFGGK